MVGDNVVLMVLYVVWVGKFYGLNVLFDSFWVEGCVFFVRMM